MPTLKVVNANTQLRIMDAAMFCFKQWGIEKVTLNDIAIEAKVSLPSLLNNFKNKEDIIHFALTEAITRLMDDILDHVDHFDRNEDRVLEAMNYALEYGPKDAYFALLTSCQYSLKHYENEIFSSKNMALMRPFFRALLQEKIIENRHLDETIEISLRLLYSFISLKGPKERSKFEMRLFLEKHLLPFLHLS